MSFIRIEPNFTILYTNFNSRPFYTTFYRKRTGLRQLFFTTTLDLHLIWPNISLKPSSPQEKFMMKRLSQFLRIFIPREWKLVHSKPYLSHMISKKNPSILKFIEEIKCRPINLHRIFQYIYFGQNIDLIQKLVINSKIFTVKY